MPMPKCQVKGLTKRYDCETCPYLDREDGYCEMLDRHIELPPERCEDCTHYAKRVNGCDKAQAFIMRRYGQDRPSWCPLEEKGEEGGQA